MKGWHSVNNCDRKLLVLQGFFFGGGCFVCLFVFFGFFFKSFHLFFQCKIFFCCFSLLRSSATCRSSSPCWLYNHHLLFCSWICKGKTNNGFLMRRLCDGFWMHCCLIGREASALINGRSVSTVCSVWTVLADPLLSDTLTYRNV